MKKLFFIFFIFIAVHGICQSWNRHLLVSNKIGEIREYVLDSSNNKRLTKISFINDSGLIVKEVQDTQLLATYEYDSLNRMTKNVTTFDHKIFSTTYSYMDGNKVKTTDSQGKIHMGYETHKKKKNKEIFIGHLDGKIIHKVVRKTNGNKRTSYYSHIRAATSRKIIEYKNSNNLVIKSVDIYFKMRTHLKPANSNCKEATITTQFSYNKEDMIEKECRTYSKCYSNNASCTYYEYIKR